MNIEGKCKGKKKKREGIGGKINDVQGQRIEQTTENITSTWSSLLSLQKDRADSRTHGCSTNRGQGFVPFCTTTTPSIFTQR